MLPDISSEQKDIVESLQTNHVFVDAIAGSGKTTTALHIAKEYYDCKVLLLTYNARLKLETRIKIIENKLDNIEAHSYHSFCVKYYDKFCYTDAPMRSILTNRAVKLQPYQFQIIIIDEAQDITLLYYELIRKILLDNHFNTYLCLLGDEFQSIYQFMDADSRFLTFSDKIYDNNREWIRLKLSVSYRLLIRLC